MSSSVTHPKTARSLRSYAWLSNRKRFGKGTLALIAKIGIHQPDGWVFENQILEALAKHRVPREKVESLIAQFVRVKIIEERVLAENLCYRVSIPLLLERFVEQNLDLKSFRRF
jgi:hypothetical protein